MKTRKMVFTALLIACCYVGAQLKIMGSIAFDSMPAFLGALLLGPGYGALIGAVGHFLTALTSGFPLSLPVHIITMASMALTMFLFGITYNFTARKINGWAARIIGSVVAVIINGPIALAMVIPITGAGIFMAYLPVLCAAAAINVIIAEAVYSFMPSVIKDKSKEAKACK